MRNLEKIMWEIVKYLGAGYFSWQGDALVYSVRCSCGNPHCGDEVVLKDDYVMWTRTWGSADFWDRWKFYEDDIVYEGTVTDGGFRTPPVMFEIMPE